MANAYVVIDREGFTSGNAKDGAPESFKTLASARKRACDLARLAPGETIRVFEAIEECIAPVLPATVKPVRKS